VALAEPLRERRVTEDLLVGVQRRREFPTRVTQQVQVFAHKGMKKIFENPGPAIAPWQLKLAVRIPGVQHLTARVIGIGVLPEHIKGARKKSSVGSLCVKSLTLGVGVMTAAAVLGACILRNRRKRAVMAQ
jgi:hypothetical protein